MVFSVFDEKGNPRRIHARIVGSEAAHIELDHIMRLNGETITAWANMEDLLVAVLSILAECPYKAARTIYYSPSNFSARLEIVNNLALHQMPEGPEKRLLRKIIAKIQRLSKTRNRLVHSRLSVTTNLTSIPPTSHVTRTVVQPHREEFEERSRISAADIQTHLDRLETLWQLLMGMIDTGSPYSARAVAAWEMAAFNMAATTSKSV